MRTLIFILALIVFQSKSNAQQISGEAHYQTKQKGKIEISGTGMTEARKKEITKQFKKSLHKEFTLTFTSQASLWKQDESMNVNLSSGNNMAVSLGGDKMLYKNTATRSYIRQDDFMGKLFSIRDSLPEFNWRLEDETKKIGNYTCYKATYIKETEQPDFLKVHTDKDKEKGNKKEEQPSTVKKQVIVTAWYTPEIPVNNGPDSYWGLPGLILEIHDGGKTMICDRIVLKDEAVDLPVPDKGKVVDEEEMKKIRQDKYQEMQKMHKKSGNKKSSGISITITKG
ncbi:GLPGLI family protein [Sinomicrobium weinanense]|uniref:GLPGLI family protein n=1 Tax=Sinomicrobium weinanense TaxID=2842200 RepID=A0A926JRN7_9FLAO|nr:GLPGLI family protein [Sinomicrobium weinanense]MBC9796129.1 GLPGLI family protein [Sinomicrobium weinanense]MBU3121880.1 GLPGLI family protein [Sinomicrobium weinanense]